MTNLSCVYCLKSQKIKKQPGECKPFFEDSTILCLFWMMVFLRGRGGGKRWRLLFCDLTDGRQPHREDAAEASAGSVALVWTRSGLR